jgi:hypothetical protein
MMMTLKKEDDDEEGGTRGLVLQLDTGTAVDPKFIPQLELKMEELTTSELLDARPTGCCPLQCTGDA